MTQIPWGRRAIGAASLAWTCAGLAADVEPTKPNETTKGRLPSIVVTATKTPTTPDRTASSLTVIDREEIERQQFRLLADALRLVPGLTLADRGAPGTVSGVFLRGTKTEVVKCEPADGDRWSVSWRRGTTLSQWITRLTRSSWPTIALTPKRTTCRTPAP